MKKERNSAMELLRILSMFIIVMHHYVVHGNVEYMNISNFPFLNGILLQWMSLGGKLGCLIFICITGYYQIKSKINAKRLILLLFQVQFYTFVIYLIDVFFLGDTLNVKDLIRSIFPTIFNQYWFFTAYFVLYLLSPALNRIVMNSSKRELLFFIGIFTFLWFLIPSFGGSDMFGNALPLLMLMYICGAYIRLYLNGDKVFIIAKQLLGLSICALLLSVFAFNLLGMIVPVFSEHSTHFANMNSIILFFISVTALVVFANIKPFTNRFLNTLSGTTFGIYLIHDNRFIGPYIWGKLFNNTLIIDSPLFVIFAIGSCVIVFLVCSVIEFLRQHTIGRVLDIFVSKGVIFIAERVNMIIKEER